MNHAQIQNLNTTCQVIHSNPHSIYSHINSIFILDLQLTQKNMIPKSYLSRQTKNHSNIKINNNRSIKLKKNKESLAICRNKSIVKN
jgi:hypothetical protein